MTNEGATYFELLRSLFHGAPIVKHVPQRMTALEEGRATIELPFDARLCHGGGAVHGGVLMLLLDNAAYFACATVSGGKWVSTAEFNVNLLESVRERPIRAEGRVLKRGRHLMHAEARAYCGQGDETKLIAVGTGTWAILPRPFRAPPAEG